MVRAVPADDVRAQWDAFVERHPSGWFWHTSQWRAYQRAYFPQGRDLSFALLDVDGRIRAAVPLFFIRGEFAYGARSLPEPLCDEQETWNYVAAEVRSLAFCNDARRWSYEALGADAASASVRRRIVDPVDGLSWLAVRDSYKSLINRAGREYEISVVTGDCEQGAAAFAEYQSIHRREYGAPRSDATYRMQGDWVREGRAVVATAQQSSVTWGAAYWIVYKGEAYYASGAYAARDVSHALVWRSLLRLRDLGVRRACLGYLGEATNDKERSIEFFKRGFSGFDEFVARVAVNF